MLAQRGATERSEVSVSNLLVTADGAPAVNLHNFNDQVVVRLRLPKIESGAWMLIARVELFNGDPDDQDAS